jgi:hypothetical protein
MTKKLPLRPIVKAKLTGDGERVLQILQREYQMEREAAIRLMRDGGPMLALAIVTRGR